jgi:hypothetical protein
MKRLVKTDFPVAFDSPDHLIPYGTKKDLSRQPRFEVKLISYMNYKEFNKILDLGCSGGAYISNMHDLGFYAIGLEGSDYSKINKRGPWAYLADFALFTADITKPFEIISNTKNLVDQFDIITSFEVFEHLKENEIDNLFQNIKIHTHKNSRLILSISTNDSFYKGVNLHQTVKSKNWWLSKFSTLGWEECKLSMKFFNGQYLRGNRFNAKDSFEVVLKKIECQDKKIPKISIWNKLVDLNSGSKLQKILYKFVHGDNI